MQTYRLSSKIPRTFCKSIRVPHQQRAIRNMSLFQRLSPSDLSPLVTFLNEFEPARHSKHSSIKAFRPRFDVSELKDSYQLQGELPGIEQSNINLEFTDQHTLIINGRIERESHHGTPPAVEDAESTSGTTEAEPNYHKASVEDEDGPSTVGALTPAASTTTTVDDSKAKTTPKPKYWLSERSVGEFHRSFSFPSRINQDAVTASLKDGILSVIIPKAPAPVSRRIEIS